MTQFRLGDTIPLTSTQKTAHPHSVPYLYHPSTQLPKRPSGQPRPPPSALLTRSLTLHPCQTTHSKHQTSPTTAASQLSPSASSFAKPLILNILHTVKARRSSRLCGGPPPGSAICLREAYSGPGRSGLVARCSTASPVLETVPHFQGNLSIHTGLTLYVTMVM